MNSGIAHMVRRAGLRYLCITITQTCKATGKPILRLSGNLEQR
jgi:hypothetical protein